MAVFDTGNHPRFEVIASIGDRPVGRNHFLQRHRTGSQSQGWDGVEHALPDTHGAGESGNLAWADLLHQLRGDGVF